MNLTYARFELARLFRNKQNVIFSLAFPIVMFIAIAGPNKNKYIDLTGNVHIQYTRFYFAGMIGFGTIAAVVAGGARISLERQIGWNRQLRLTPLSPRVYLRTKVLTSYLLALISIAVLTCVALAFGTRFDGHDYVKGLGLILVGLIPFAAMGIFLGHLVKGDSMGPVMGGVMSLFALLGGAYFPIGDGHGFMAELAQALPSYWLIQGGKLGIGGQEWDQKAWIVIVAWSAVMGVGAAWAYRRDTERQS